MDEKFDKTVTGVLGCDVATFSGEVNFGAIIAHMNVSTTICTGNWWKRTKHRLALIWGILTKDKWVISKFVTNECIENLHNATGEILSLVSRKKRK